MNSKALSTFPYFHLFYKTNCVPLLSKQKKPHGNRQSLIALHHYHHQQSVTQNQQLAMIFMVFVLLLNYPKPPSKLGDHLPVVSITKLCYFFRSAIPLWGVRVETSAWISLCFIKFEIHRVWTRSKFKHDPQGHGDTHIIVRRNINPDMPSYSESCTIMPLVLPYYT